MDCLTGLLSILKLNKTNLEDVTDIKIDVGKKIKLVYPDGFELLDSVVDRELLKKIRESLPPFDKLHRTGFDGCLHRISGIFNAQGEMIGLTVRIARELQGLHLPLVPWLNQGLLILGPPAYGKTSSLRNIANYLSDDMNREVVIVDKSNEIAGYGDISHPIVGLARRLPVKDQSKQVEAMLEAVENHSPHVIIVDEIRNEAEAYAAKTIAERGVDLVATAHAYTLQNLLKNPVGQILLGGVTDVAISDKTAKANDSGKVIISRKYPPTFSTVVELLSRTEIAVYTNLEYVIDNLLQGKEVEPTILRKIGDKWVTLKTQTDEKSIEGTVEERISFKTKKKA